MDQQSPVFILIQIVLPIGVIFALVYKYVDFVTRTTHVVCPMCRSSFKLTKQAFAFSLKTGVMNERVVTCPACGHRGGMPVMKD
ncbi:hypothetical protein H8B09_16770 [Paenibacillus sp. PR3]|uniref:Zinc ribbon domain-containing protein n=1 Tax=Paenibacillus terricola TaxID=2763503 RepID=A0ABR8MWS9_9BACL|nr:hypothetical protein [Paenibacillus terricola]MBD3920417.1 hypothetical protein [Paenibacillus terricola]